MEKTKKATENTEKKKATPAKSKAAQTAKKKGTVAKRPQRNAKKENLAPHKLVLLITIVNRNKAEFYLDLLQSFEVNMQISVLGMGTAAKSFGLLKSDWEKQVLFSIIRKDNVKRAMETLEEKFASIRGGKGIACTVPLTSTIGVAVYQFLSNRNA